MRGINNPMRLSWAEQLKVAKLVSAGKSVDLAVKSVVVARKVRKATTGAFGRSKAK
jgi:hypothetical protein